MEKKLKHRKTEYCLIYAKTFPFITPRIIGKHLFTSYWLQKPGEATKLAASTLNHLVRKGALTRAKTHNAIYVRAGKDKRMGTQYPFHNLAVASVLMNLDLHGYSITYGGQGNADGTIFIEDECGMYVDQYAIEVDTGNHSAGAIYNQLMKYEKSKVKKILYITYPRFYLSLGDDENYDLQADQEKSLRRKMKKHKIPKEIREKILSTTYTQASDPTQDPLTAKIWRTLEGSYQSVLR